jgi:hypothetical protein
MTRPLRDRQRRKREESTQENQIPSVMVFVPALNPDFCGIEENILSIISAAIRGIQPDPFCPE